MIIILPSAIIAGRVISGELEVGRAIQATGAFAAILSALTVIVDNFEALSHLQNSPAPSAAPHHSPAGSDFYREGSLLG